MAFEDIKNALTTSGNHLGDLVWWTLSDAAVDRATLESTWNNAKLPVELLPEPPTAEKALKVSVRETAVGKPDLLIRLGKEDEQQIIFAVVREHRQPDGSVTFTQEARIVLDRATERLTADSASHPAAHGVLTAFARLRTTHTADDVRRTVVRTLHGMAAITLRDGGGIYWVPKTHADGLRRLQGAVERIGSSRMYLLPVHDSADANRTLGEAAKLSIEEDLAGLQAEIDGFLQSPPDRPSTLVRRFDAFEALRQRAELYHQVLKVQVEALDTRLVSMARAVETLLSQKSAA
ncbi:MAG: DUF6744 family protein [Myxococcota bacterium]